jgi:hypothetical protein
VSARLSRLPVPHHLSQSEAIGYLRRGVFEDAVKFGWLRPCVRKTGRGRDSVFYRWADVETVSLRVASGEYPGGVKAGAFLRQD